MSFSLDISWDSVGLARTITRGKLRLEQIPRAALQHVAPSVKERAIEISPKKTGRFAKLWRYRTSNVGTDGAQLALENTDTKAAAVLFGSSAHTVYPRNGRALRFETQGGDVVFAKHVNTPALPGTNVFQLLEEDVVFQHEVQGAFDIFLRQLAENP